MPDQELLDDFLEALECAGRPRAQPGAARGPRLPEVQYEEVEADLAEGAPACQVASFERSS